MFGIVVGDERENCLLLTEKWKLRASLGKGNGNDLETEREKMDLKVFFGRQKNKMFRFIK